MLHDRISMSISGNSLGASLEQQYEFPFGINIVQFFFFTNENICHVRIKRHFQRKCNISFNLNLMLSDIVNDSLSFPLQFLGYKGLSVYMYYLAFSNGT